MKLRPMNVRRRARQGKGLLPPNPNQWNNEHNGLDLRERLGLKLDESLSHEAAFHLLSDVTVIPHGQLPLAQIFVDRFRKSGSKTWSGMAVPLPTGGTMVIFNDSHPPTRIRATLMEEFFHLHLGHPVSRVRVYTDDGAHRDYRRGVEVEAYGSGAAALLPYRSLDELLKQGDSLESIATIFNVSKDLVLFRAKVTKLYRLVRR
jgi:hypothetical protein